MSFSSKKYFLLTFGIGAVLNFGGSILMGIFIMLDVIVSILNLIPYILYHIHHIIMAFHCWYYRCSLNIFWGWGCEIVNSNDLLEPRVTN